MPVPDPRREHDRSARHCQDNRGPLGRCALEPEAKTQQNKACSCHPERRAWPSQARTRYAAPIANIGQTAAATAEFAAEAAPAAAKAATVITTPTAIPGWLEPTIPPLCPSRRLSPTVSNIPSGAATSQYCARPNPDPDAGAALTSINSPKTISGISS
jgi:hypothetical protein